jgi:peptidoglycan-associated lipoprotein
MKRSFARILPLAVLAFGLVLAAGCSRKTPAQEPPAPPPAPPVVRDTTPPTPPPQETPAPTPPSVRSEDFQPAFFDLDSDALREDARAALDADAKLLRDNPTVQITIEGHCDERGTAEYNQALGERRANAARDYLVNAGIDAARLQSVSYGKERPFNPGHDEAAWAQNRRAHIVVR